MWCRKRPNDASVRLKSKMSVDGLCLARQDFVRLHILCYTLCYWVCYQQCGDFFDACCVYSSRLLCWPVKPVVLTRQGARKVPSSYVLARKVRRCMVSMLLLDRNRNHYTTIAHVKSPTWWSRSRPWSRPIGAERSLIQTRCYCISYDLHPLDDLCLLSVGSVRNSSCSTY